MKKIHIALLVLIAGAIAVLLTFLQTGGTYDSIAGAKQNPGKFFHISAKLDKSEPVTYDELKDPNFLSFTAVDSTGEKMKVVYRKGKIDNLQISERIVLKGKYEGDHFECKDVQTKCPSKYKDNIKPTDKNLQENNNTDTKPVPANSEPSK